VTTKERRDLIGEHALGDTGQIILACLFLTTWTADTFFLQWTIFLNRYVPLIFRMPPGIVLLFLSGYLARKGLAIVFGEHRNEPVVIREGVFSVVRHPIYLSEILFYLGLLMLSPSLAAIWVWIVAVGFLHYISRYEEKLLLARFGEEYRQYMEDVPMWIPKFRKNNKKVLTFIQ
jgi:protein-S-isoprenylcysteine O-methyltransferase Ste14